jgi:hypothetical protein
MNHSHFDQFANSADPGYKSYGIKGPHHKQLINAVLLDHHKFSRLHGLASRKERMAHWENNTHKITHKLFQEADEKHLHSFIGVTHLIKHHIPKSEHQAIYDKFKKMSVQINLIIPAAVSQLKKELQTKD